MNNVDILDVAEFIVLRLTQLGIDINHLKLQKILYYMQSWHLVYFDNPLFNDIPEAWVNGPVYRTVYDEYKKYSLYKDLKSTFSHDNQIRIHTCLNKLKFDSDKHEFIDAIFTKYASKTHDALVLLTHAEMPWKNARKNIDAFSYSNEMITHASMKEYYSSLLPSHE